MSPLVSIIIPTYNRQALLPEAVASCFAQTYSELEIVIIDDGSTDGTRTMVEGLLKGSWQGRVVYYFQKNGGTSSAKNHGLRVARGEFIQFLDSDDVLRPDKISRQMAAIQSANGEADVCTCRGRLGYLADGWDSAKSIGENCATVAACIDRQCERTVHILHTEAPLWRKEFLARSPGWREDLCVAEEWEYYIRLFAQNPRMVEVDAELFWVRAHEGEQLSKDFGSLKHCQSFFGAIRTVEELLRPTSFWTPTARAGLLSRARTTYVNMLRRADKPTLHQYETWLGGLASSASDRRVSAIISLRRCVGSKFLLKSFDLVNRLKRSRISSAAA